MDSFYTIVGLLTAGVALCAGLINVFIGLRKGSEKYDLLFGIMCLSIFVFFMLPPIGFILEDKAPYVAQIKLKRVFNFGFSALLPWFIFLYSGLKKKTIPIIVSAIVITCYVVMWFTTIDSLKPTWVYFVLLHDTIIVGYGFYGGIAQIRNGEKSKGRWFIAAMCFVGVLYALTMINQLGNNYFGKILGTKLFFPENLYPLPFFLIMSLRLRTNIFEKYRLQKLLQWKQMHWGLLEQSMQLLIIELDTLGNITHLNPYAVKALGYTTDNELINKNWFDVSAPKDELATRKTLFSSAIEEQKVTPYFTSHLLSRYGKMRIINWSSILVYDDSQKLKGTLSVGLDITEQEEVFEQVKSLKNEIEKETLFSKAKELDVFAQDDIVGKSDAILYAIQKAMQVANTHAAVLLEGETGVGKELFANLIHKHSNRSDKVFIKINCAALPAELIESELFGHEKGAFTGAINARKGRFELADGGTIFLDEIGELPLVLQPKLLRVLQTGEFERIGSTETVKVDVRIISATNRDLTTEIKAGRFREDLYFRLNVFPVTIPPLRNRKEDIPTLVSYYVKKLLASHNKHVENISKADMVRLCEYAWPGNIRELINVIERSIISSTDDTLKLDWLKVRVLADRDDRITSSIEGIEKAHILKILKECNWKINGDDGAAVKLGLHPNTLRSRLKKLNIARNTEA